MEKKGVKPRVHVLRDLEAISHKAANIFVSLFESSAAAQGKFTVALAGGSTPKRLYALLSSRRFRHKVDWPHVHFFWGDERCVPKEDPESNFKSAYDLLLSKVPVPAENIHRMKGEKDPAQGARDYEEDLRKFFGTRGWPALDLIILGMGEDGHTASLFPASKSLAEKLRLVVPIYMKKHKIHRITLTLPVLNHAAQILFLVAGHAKADVLQKVLQGGREKERYPAGLIHPGPAHILWLIDRETARKLKVTK